MKLSWLTTGRTLTASALLVSLTLPLGATIVTTRTSRTAWEADVSLVTIKTADFEEPLSMGGGTFQTYNNAAGYTPTDPLLNFFNFVGQVGTGYEFVRNDTGGSRVGRGPVYVPGVDNLIVVNLSNAAKAFGIEISSNVPGLAFEITVQQTSGTDTLSTTPTAGAVGSANFIGFTTDSAISKVTLKVLTTGATPNSSTEFYIDNASTADPLSGDPPPPSGVPEPSTYLTFGLGLLGLAWTRYRRTASLRG